MSKISDLSLPSQRNLPTKGKLETGIEILIKALKNRIIGIGLPITEEPSHTTRHTDRVPGRFG